MNIRRLKAHNSAMSTNYRTSKSILEKPKQMILIHIYYQNDKPFKHIPLLNYNTTNLYLYCELHLRKLC